ncbi:MAG: pyridoxal 5'-phosphate synthase glutaminase subunit PdxT [Candidatus Gracilibacteria bacterium]
MKKKIGVLDIQGSVEEHFAALEKAGAEAVLVKNKEGLKLIDGLIIPGGESTTIGKLLKESGMDKEIMKLRVPIYGSCAGAILLAKKISGREKAPNLGLMDIEIERNAYGRQTESFETEVVFDGKKIPAIFIRAPKIKKIGKDVKVLAMDGKDIVAVREGRFLATMFHPELTEDLSVHRYFLKMC